MSEKSPKTRRDERPPANGEVKVTADAGEHGSMRPVPLPSFGSGLPDDDWTEAEANAFMDELVERNKEALRGLAKL